MFTADPGRRRSVLEEVQTILLREAAPEDRDLLLSLAPFVYADMPDAMALGLPSVAIPAVLQEVPGIEGEGLVGCSNVDGRVRRVREAVREAVACHKDLDVDPLEVVGVRTGGVIRTGQGDLESEGRGTTRHPARIVVDG